MGCLLPGGSGYVWEMKAFGGEGYIWGWTLKTHASVMCQAFFSFSLRWRFGKGSLYGNEKKFSF